MLLSVFDVLRIFEALQVFFYKLLLEWGKTEEDFESSIFLEAQKYYFAFEIKAYFFFEMLMFATLFRRSPTLWKSKFKMTTLFRRCLALFNSTLKYTMVFQRCWTLLISTLTYTTLFQRWFDVVRRHDIILTEKQLWTDVEMFSGLFFDSKSNILLWLIFLHTRSLFKKYYIDVNEGLNTFIKFLNTSILFW